VYGPTRDLLKIKQHLALDPIPQSKHDTPSGYLPGGFFLLLSNLPHPNPACGRQASPFHGEGTAPSLGTGEGVWGVRKTTLQGEGRRGEEIILNS